MLIETEAITTNNIVKGREKVQDLQYNILGEIIWTTGE